MAGCFVYLYNKELVIVELEIFWPCRRKSKFCDFATYAKIG